MTDVKAYYFGSFERDLESVIGNQIPRSFGGTWRTQGCPELEKVSSENRPAFVSCLYYSMLFDQGLCHDSDDEYRKSGLLGGYPKFKAPDKIGHMNPRGILRFPIHNGVVSSGDLANLATPAADLFVAEFADIVDKLLPQVSLANFFFLLTNCPEVNYWSPRVIRRYPLETKVEQKFLAELLNAWGQTQHGRAPSR
jgi:hypothetical protein